MITFHDGPAEGVTLALRRAPLLLRVVQSAGGEWDALDQLTDEPRPREKLFAYYRASEVRLYHLKCSRRSGSGFYAMATYHHFEHQPDDAVMRDTAAWRAWCEANGPTIEWRLKSKPAQPEAAI